MPKEKPTPWHNELKAIAFDVQGTCANTPFSCSTEGGTSVTRTEWEANNTGGMTNTWTAPNGPVPGAVMFVRVRATGATCEPYDISLFNG